MSAVALAKVEGATYLWKSIPSKIILAPSGATSKKTGNMPPLTGLGRNLYWRLFYKYFAPDGAATGVGLTPRTPWAQSGEVLIDFFVAWLLEHRHCLRIVTEISPHLRFREARERLGLSPDELAVRSGVLHADVWEIEGLDGDLTSCYSPKQVQQFCRVLGIRPIKLFADSIEEPPVSASELARLIHAECRARGITLEQFEDMAELRLTTCIEPPEKLLEDMTVDGLQWLCRELQIDWRRVILSL